MIGITDLAGIIPENTISYSALAADGAERLALLQAQFRHLEAFREFSGFGIPEVRCADDSDALALAAPAIDALMKRNNAGDIGLIVDFSTVIYPQRTLSGRVQAYIGQPRAKCLDLTSGGCASFHLSLWTVSAIFHKYPELRSALLVASDIVPFRSRLCFPLSVLGDGASAVILSRENVRFELLAVSYKSLGDVAAAVGIPSWRNEPVSVDIPVFENRLLPIYFKAVYDVIREVFNEAGLGWDQVDIVVYPNMSEMDRDAFRRAFRLPKEKFPETNLQTQGHVFASDMILNLEQFMSRNLIQPGMHVLMLSSGAGFHWGAALLRMK